MKQAFYIQKERGAVALATLAFLASLLTLALIILWSVTQIIAAQSLLQTTAQTAAYAASNATASADSTEIACSSAELSNHYLCSRTPGAPSGSEAALDSAEAVFAQAFNETDNPAVFGLCYSTATNDCDGKSKVVLRARSGRDTSPAPAPTPSIKVFNIKPSAASTCTIYSPTSYTLDRDFGYDLSKVSADLVDIEDYSCWVFSEEKSWTDENENKQSAFMTVKNFFYRTPGVIVRAEATLDILPLLPSLTIEAAASAARGQPLAPTTPGGYLPEPATYNLLLEARGQGSVEATDNTGSPLLCTALPSRPGACFSTVSKNTTFDLKATATPGFTFLRWQGDIPDRCRTSATCQDILMSRFSREIVAVFTASQLTIDPPSIGGSIVSLRPRGAINCASLCQKDFPLGRYVTLLARPLPGYRFSAWLGAPPSCTSDRCRVQMTSDLNISAEFQPE